MTEGEQPQAALLTAYTVSVYVDADIDDEALDSMLDLVEGELHADLFQLAARLERQFPIKVVAIDEAGAGWIAGGLGYRPELGREQVGGPGTPGTRRQAPGGEITPPALPAR